MCTKWWKLVKGSTCAHTLGTVVKPVACTTSPSKEGRAKNSNMLCACNTQLQWLNIVTFMLTLLPLAWQKKFIIMLLYSSAKCLQGTPWLKKNFHVTMVKARPKFWLLPTRICHYTCWTEIKILHSFTEKLKCVHLTLIRNTDMIALLKIS